MLFCVDMQLIPVSTPSVSCTSVVHFFAVIYLSLLQSLSHSRDLLQKGLYFVRVLFAGLTTQTTG